MRIAFVSTMRGAPWGGSEELWAQTAQLALKRGHAVCASVVEWPQTPKPLATLEQAGITLLRRARPAPPHRPRLPERLLRPLVRLRRAIKPQASPSPYAPVLRYQPEVVLINQGSTYDCAQQPQARQLITDLIAARIPYILLCHGPYVYGTPDAEPRRWARQFFSSAARVAVLGDGLRALSERQLAMPLNNTVNFANPVNLTDTSPVTWPEDARQVRLANVARLEVAQKGHDVLLDVLRNEPWKHRPWHLSLYGDGPDVEYLKELVDFYRLKERVEFAGHVSDIRSVWAAQHLLAMPSRIEGVPLTLVEAMLCARPVVITDVGGTVDWVEDGRTGFLAEAPTTRSFAAAMERAWQARERWPQIGLAAHEKAARRVDPDPADSLLKILEQVHQEVKRQP